MLKKSVNIYFYTQRAPQIVKIFKKMNPFYAAKWLIAHWIITVLNPFKKIMSSYEEEALRAKRF